MMFRLSRCAFAVQITSTVLLCAFIVGVGGYVFAATSINEIFSDFERQYQLPNGCLAKIARVESNGNPNARSGTSSAAGMFQWLNSSWIAASGALNRSKGVGPYDLSLRYNPVRAAEVTAFALRDVKNHIGGLIAQAGVDECLGLYMGHFLGKAGAQKFFQAYLQDPRQNACALFPKGCAANGSVLRTSLAGVLQNFGNKLGTGGPIALPGNFEMNGVPLSRTHADISLANYLPANTTVAAPSEWDYYTPYTAAAQTAPTQPSLYPPLNQSSALKQPSTLPQVPQPKPVSELLLGTANNSESSSSSTSSAVPPASGIIVQRAVIQRGETAVVSWTSVGMSKTNTCHVSYSSGDATYEVGRANQGTEKISLDDTFVGTLTFTMRCTDVSGEVITRSAKVSVE